MPIKAKTGRVPEGAKLILSLTSHLALALREAGPPSLRAARDRMEEFSNRWLRDGEEDILPCSDDIDGVLSDTDVFDAIRQIVDDRIARG